MSQKYHINPETMEPGVCNAKTPEACLYYDSDNNIEAEHFSNKTEARKYIEKVMKKEVGNFNTFGKEKITPETLDKVKKSTGEEEPRKTGVEYNTMNMNKELEELSYLGVGEKLSEETIQGLTFETFEKSISRSREYASPVKVSGNIEQFDFTSDPELYKKFGFHGIEKFRKGEQSVNSKYISTISEASVSSLTDEEKRDLRWFTGQDYTAFNRVMFRRSNISENHPYYKEFRRKMQNLDTALAKAPKVNKTVYRGVERTASIFRSSRYGDTPDERIDNYIAENYKVGETINFKGYQSSSTKIDQARKWGKGGVIYEIKTPEGMPISSVSHAEIEDEVLLPRDSSYVIVGVQKENNLRVVQLLAVNDEGDVLNGTNSGRKNTWDELQAQPLENEVKGPLPFSPFSEGF